MLKDYMNQINENIENVKPVRKVGRPAFEDPANKLWVLGSDHVKSYYSDYHKNTKEIRYRLIQCDGCDKQYPHALKCKHAKSKYHIKQVNLKLQQKLISELLLNI